LNIKPVFQRLNHVTTQLSAAGDTSATNPYFFPNENIILFQTAFPLANEFYFFPDLYARNVETGALQLITTLPDGRPLNATGPLGAHLSSDGTKVLFVTYSSPIPGAPEMQNVFVKDLNTGATSFVNKNSAGSPIFAYSGAVFSPDGNSVAFIGDFHDDLGAGGQDIYVKNLTTGALIRAGTVDRALGHGGVGTVAVSTHLEFSPDGSKILFSTGYLGDHYDSNGLPVTEVYTWTIGTGAFTLLSTTASGSLANSASFNARFSPDGSKIAFISHASDLVAGDTNGRPDVFIKDLTTGAVQRVSTLAGGQEIFNVNLGGFTFFPDNSRIIFTFNNVAIIKNLLTGATETLSTTSGGGNPAVSHDGTHVVVGGTLFTVAGKPVYVAGGPAAQVVPAVAVSDIDSDNYGGGRIEVEIGQGYAGGDALTLATSSTQGFGLERVGTQLLLNGVAMGSVSEAAGRLVIALAPQANDAAVEAIVEAVRISSAEAHPSDVDREVRFTLIDGGGTAGGGEDRSSFTVIVDFVASPRPRLFGDDANAVDFNLLSPAAFPGPFNLALGGADIITLPQTASGLSAWGLQAGFHGGEGGDVITAGSAGVIIYGDADNDTLNGGAGEDRLEGGDGNDVLLHFVGNAADDLAPDVLLGGAGSDAFHIGHGDTVYDAEAGEVITLDGALASDLFYISEADANGNVMLRALRATGGDFEVIGEAAIRSDLPQVSFSFHQVDGQTRLTVEPRASATPQDWQDTWNEKIELLVEPAFENFQIVAGKIMLEYPEDLAEDLAAKVLGRMVIAGLVFLGAPEIAIGAVIVLTQKEIGDVIRDVAKVAIHEARGEYESDVELATALLTAVSPMLGQLMLAADLAQASAPVLDAIATSITSALASALDDGAAKFAARGLLHPDSEGAIIGTSVDDVILGTGQGTRLIGYGGDDILIGGSRSDIADYGSATRGIFVDLKAQVATDLPPPPASSHRVTLATTGVNVIGRRGDDILIGENRADIADYGSATRGIFVYLNARVVTDLPPPHPASTLATTSADLIGRDVLIDIHRVAGSAWDDILSGSEAADFLSGAGGDDQLKGAGGADMIEGGAGNDLIQGGAGSDTLEGGAGADIFVFDGIGDSRLAALRSDGVKFLPDRIGDFVSGEDRIDLSGIDAKAATGANDAFTFIGAAAFTGQAGQLRYDNAGGIMRIMGDVDGDGRADFEIVAITPILQATDFIL
jgi:Tol biopolymer transport system component